MGVDVRVERLHVWTTTRPWRSRGRSERSSPNSRADRPGVTHWGRSLFDRSLRPRTSATRTRVGRCVCSAWFSSSPRSNGCPMTLFDGHYTGWITCGSGRATTWTRTRSARKKRRIRRQIRALPPHSVVLAQDETDLLLFPPLRAAWSKRGEDCQGLAERPQCPACDLRGDEFADGDTVVRAAREGAEW